MSQPSIDSLFHSDIHRRIEEVIKVDQGDEDVVAAEVSEYVVTDSIASHFVRVLERYRETPQRPHEGIAVWVSGFFGSGKSSFAKLLGLALADRPTRGETAGRRLARRAREPKVTVLLDIIREQIPTHAVIFDVSTDRGIRSGNQTLTEIMYGLFLQSLDYARDLDLSELEIGLEQAGQLETFEAKYRETFKKEWAKEKGKVAFAFSEASRVMHLLDYATYPSPDSWSRAAKHKADITPGKLAERCSELMKVRGKGKSLVFVIDEVGQFVARDVQKMLDLQAVVQALGVRGRGKHWVMVTSQEKLGEIVSGLDDNKIELARLMDRFPTQVHLEPSDISEVTSKRVLSKSADAEKRLGELFDPLRARLTQNTRVTADIRLPELTRDGFIDLYPLLPYQVDLIIQIVSGLRTQGGASKHVGGANRTIIKLAQQLLVHPAVSLATEPLGALARLDHVYDLVQENIASEVRAKIARIPSDLAQPQARMAHRVAKAVCLLQFVRSVHRSAENLAAVLHPSVDADSQLTEVKAALDELVRTHHVRLGDDGYRIPTPAEDDWERVRQGLDPKRADRHRIIATILETFWQPQPTATLYEARSFKAGLVFRGQSIAAGDIEVRFEIAESREQFESLAAEQRALSQTSRKAIFWSFASSDAIDREANEIHRCRHMLDRKERDARTADEGALISEERVRLRRHTDELRRLLRLTVLSGAVYFRGYDRSPPASAQDVGKAATALLGPVLTDVYERLGEAAARVTDVKKGLDAVLTAQNLSGLPPVFKSLDLTRVEGSAVVFRIESGPLKEVVERIAERAHYGQPATGVSLTTDLAKEPFGWDFEVVRLLVVCLFRHGALKITVDGQRFDKFVASARDALTNNVSFKQARFEPKISLGFEQLTLAADACAKVFGEHMAEMSASALGAALRRLLPPVEDEIRAAHHLLATTRLPGIDLLDRALGSIRHMLRSNDEDAIESFIATHAEVSDARKRAKGLCDALLAPQLAVLETAQQTLERSWPMLEASGDVSDAAGASARALAELLARESFYRDLPAIEMHARLVEAELAEQRGRAVEARERTYEQSRAALMQTPGFEGLDEPIRSRLLEPFSTSARAASGARLTGGAASRAATETLLQIRTDVEACPERLRRAIAEVRRLLDDGRTVRTDFASYFTSGIETEAQLDAVLDNLRTELLTHLRAGKRVLPR